LCKLSLSIFFSAFGGYSVLIQLPTTTKPITPYMALLAILTAIFTTIKRKTKRKH